MPEALARKLFVILAVVSFAGVSSFPQSTGEKPVPLEAAVQLAGTWRGTSVCMVKDSPCHDEVNVYHIAAVAGKADTYSVTGSKIVDGREVVMGTTRWTYDPKRHLLESETPAGKFVLFVRGDKMEGGLLRDCPGIHAPIPCDPFDCTSPPDIDAHCGIYFRRIHLMKIR